MLKKHIAALAALTLLAVAPVFAQEAAGVKVGDAAPDFKLKDQTGKEWVLSEHKGKLVVLEWTNPECPFVVKHLKAETTTKLADKWKAKDVAWLKIDSSNFITEEKAKKAVEDNKINVPVLLDAGGETGKAYGAKTTPHLFIVDKEGKIAYAGAYDDNPTADAKEDTKNYVDAALEKLVAGEKPEVASTKPYGCSVKYKK